MDLLVILALTTFVLVIAFALWSKRRTEKKQENPHSKPSSLARDEPDPNFLPDQDGNEQSDLDKR